MAAGHGSWWAHRARWAALVIGLIVSAVLALGSLAWAAEDPDALQSAADAAAQRATSLDQAARSLDAAAAAAQRDADRAAGALDQAEDDATAADRELAAAQAAVTVAEQAEVTAREALAAADLAARDPAATPEVIAAAASAGIRLQEASKAAQDSRDLLAKREEELVKAQASLELAEDDNEEADAEAIETAKRSRTAQESADLAAREAASAAERARQARAEDDARKRSAAQGGSSPSAPGSSFDSGARPAEPSPAAPTAPAVPAPPRARARPVLLSPFPIVRIRGRLTRTGAVVNLVSVRAPKGARVAVRCRGRGCPARVQARTARLLTFKRLRRHLRAGAVLEIRVTRAGTIGKYTRFVIRRGKSPLRRDSCLRPDGVKPMRCPST